MALLQWAVLGDSVEHVMNFLDSQHLGRLESAGRTIDRKVTSRCWEALVRMERSMVEWRLWLLEVFPDEAFDKQALKELLSLKLNFNSVPVSWSHQIISVGPTSLRVSPSKSTDTAIDGVSETRIVPPLATVPLALGITFGDKLSVGIHIESKIPCVSEGIWFGVELQGLLDSWGLCMALLCCPFTGQCMLRGPGDVGTVEFVAQAMPPLTQDLCDSVEIYVLVSESGDVEFKRFCPSTNSSDRSGRMTRDMFPQWATEIFAAVNVQADCVSSDTLITARCPTAASWQLDVKECHPSHEFYEAWSLRE